MIAIVEIKGKLFRKIKEDCQYLKKAFGERSIDSCSHDKKDFGCVSFDYCPRLSTEQVFFIDGVMVGVRHE